jgi:hypothetical protein
MSNRPVVAAVQRCSLAPSTSSSTINTKLTEPIPCENSLPLARQEITSQGSQEHHGYILTECAGAPQKCNGSAASAVRLHFKSLSKVYSQLKLFSHPICGHLIDKQNSLDISRLVPHRNSAVIYIVEHACKVAAGCLGQGHVADNLLRSVGTGPNYGS